MINKICIGCKEAFEVMDKRRKYCNKDCFLKYNVVWNKGKKGLQKAWNKGLTKEDPRILKYISTEGCKSVQFKKGQSPKIKGKTFEEFYGKERAKEIMKKQLETKKDLYDRGLLVPHNKGKTFLVGEKNPMYGKKHRDSSKEKMSKIRIKLIKDGKIKVNFKGQHHTEYSKKKMSETRKQKIKRGDKDIVIYQEGEKNPVWLGGISFEPYPLEFNKKFKRAIRQRDYFHCLKCNLSEENHIKLINKRLTCHHIDYIKENTFKENCCTLCNRCNAEVNFNRPHWIKFFQSLLSERYGYEYSELNEIIINM